MIANLLHTRKTMVIMVDTEAEEVIEISEEDSKKEVEIEQKIVQNVIRRMQDYQRQ